MTMGTITAAEVWESYRSAVQRRQIQGEYEGMDIPQPCAACGLPAFNNDVCQACYEATPGDDFDWNDVEDWQ